MSNKISEITRRNIFDFIQVEEFWWAGRLEEVNFLSRIFNLEKMKSYDSRFENAAGDIWQHRINNPNDWPDDWIFHDERFNLLRCDDSVFLNFLCEMIHPLVSEYSGHIVPPIPVHMVPLSHEVFRYQN